MTQNEIYRSITDRIITQLEQGIIPWRKPWTGTNGGAISGGTGKPYSLLNQMLLQKPGRWYTFAEAKKLGGNIIKGSHGTVIYFWRPLITKEKDKDGKEVEKIIPLLRQYIVFHESQCTGLPHKAEEESFHNDPIPEAEKIKSDYIAKSHMEIRECISNEAFYSPSMDYIQIPCREQYADINEFYGTLFHEMIHSTGHRTRLNRLNRTAAFGSEEYSKEELVAEIGAASLLNYVGIETPETFTNNTAYIQSWLRALQNDTRMLVGASSQAGKAVDYIIGCTVGENI